MTFPQPQKVNARSWSELARHFERIDSPWPAHVALRALCEHVKRAAYRDLLFGATSMHTLLVGQHAELEWHNHMLEIEATADDRIAFAFHERAFARPVEWSCSPDALIETFERFLRRTRWVSESVLPS